MKRLKIFMGAGCFCLALTAIAATKASHKTTTYYYQENSSTCAVFTGSVCTGSSEQCEEFIGPNQYGIYTSSNGTTCSVPLDTKE